MIDDLGPVELRYLELDKVLERKGVPYEEILDLAERVKEFARMIYKEPRKNAKKEIERMKNKNGANRN